MTAPYLLVDFHQTDGGGGGALERTVTSAIAPSPIAVATQSDRLVGNGLGTWLLTGQSTVPMISTDDGLTWSDASAYVPNTPRIMWDGVRFVAEPNGAFSTVWSSFDGITWASQGNATAGANQLFNFAHGIGFFGGYYVSYVYGTENKISYSTDLITWTLGAAVSVAGFGSFEFLGGPNEIIFTDGQHEIGYSTTDPTGSWTSMSFTGSPWGGGGQTIGLECPLWDGSQWVSGGHRLTDTFDMGYHTSADGITWARHTDATGQLYDLTGGAFDGTKYWYAGWDSGSTLTSILEWDGATWTRHDFTPSGDPPNYGGQLRVFPDGSLLSGAMGHVYEDPARDGSGTSPATASVALWQDVDHNGSYETLVATVATDASGVWFFASLEEGGDFQVRLVSPAAWNPTQVIAGTFTTNHDLFVVDFYIDEAEFGESEHDGFESFGPIFSDYGQTEQEGFSDPFGNIHITVGDADDVSGISLELYFDEDEDGDYVLIDTQVTDVEGLVAFQGLALGVYRVDLVEATLPAGWAEIGEDPLELEVRYGGDTREVGIHLYDVTKPAFPELARVQRRPVAPSSMTQYGDDTLINRSDQSKVGDLVISMVATQAQHIGAPAGFEEVAFAANGAAYLSVLVHRVRFGDEQFYHFPPAYGVRGIVTMIFTGAADANVHVATASDSGNNIRPPSLVVPGDLGFIAYHCIESMNVNTVDGYTNVGSANKFGFLGSFFYVDQKDVYAGEAGGDDTLMVSTITDVWAAATIVVAGVPPVEPAVPGFPATGASRQPG